MDDQRIIELIRQGHDRAAFARLYAHFPKVEHLVRANSGDRSDAKDVFQDSLVILHRRLRDERFQLTSSLGTFLYSVARNVWREELRRRGRSLRAWEGEPAAEEAPDMAALLLREGEFRQAEAALRSLSSKCVDLLKRFYIAHEALADIARSLGLAGEGAAKTRKYKCLEEARKRYRTMVHQGQANEHQPHAI